MIVNLDSADRRGLRDQGAAQGIKTIDYDRLTLGGGANYYVSFDNVAVGTAQGEGLVKCLGDAGPRPVTSCSLNGSPTDNNATLFKQGYEAADQGRRLQHRRRPVGPGLGQHQGRHDLRADLHRSDRQDRRRRRRQRRSRWRCHRRPHEEQPRRQDPGHRPGRHGRGSAARPAGHPVHDRLQGHQEGGRRCRGARDRARQGRAPRPSAGTVKDSQTRQGRSVAAPGPAGHLRRQRQGRRRRRLHHGGQALHHCGPQGRVHEVRRQLTLI